MRDERHPRTKFSWTYLLDREGSELYMSSRLYNCVGDARGCSSPRQTKRGAAVLPDSAGPERTNPFRRTETGGVNAFGARDSGAAGSQPDDRAAGAQVLVQPGASVQPAREGNVRFADEAGKEFPATALVQRGNEG